MSSYELFPHSLAPAGLCDRCQAAGPRAAWQASRILALALAVGLTGCSADITRFDFPSFNSSDNGSPPPLPQRPIGGVGAGGLPSAPAEAPSGQPVYTPPRAQRPSDVRMSSLPEPVTGGGAALPAPQAEPPRRLAPPAAVPAAPVAAAPIAKGDQIEVQQGDTLYALSKRHKVSITELMTVNDLKSPGLKPGQRLHLPAGKPTAAPQRAATRPEPVAVAPTRPDPAAAAAPAAAPTNWNGSYTIKPGDSLYAVARQHRVGLNELQSANGITDPRKVRPGTVIKVPGSGAPAVAAAPAAPPAAAPVSLPITQTQGAPRVVSQQPTIINAADVPERVAAAPAPGIATDAQPPAPQGKGTQVAGSAPLSPAASAPTAVPGGKLRWPVRGKVIAGFGPRPDGTHNDGVNLAVPLGTDVHAAEAGVVAYAGSELKGYGNLILIRHDNGWVTAYAHNDQILVKRGDKIRRGQIVAKAGKTGTVDQPQVHFELRQGSKPVDPTPHMERM